LSTKVFRIDDRLVHGQVIVGWVQRLRLNCIVVANDEAVCDLQKKSIWKLALPIEGFHFFCWSLAETVEKLNKGELEQYKYVLLVDSVRDAHRLISLGLDVQEINIGGLHFKESKKQYSDSIFLDDSDINLLKDLVSKGIHIISQPLPSDARVEIQKILPRMEMS